MEATGEQVIIGRSSLRTEQDHKARYDFAAHFVAGKRVLDIACGTGYGAPVLAAAGSTSYVGVDISSDAIHYAREHYGSPSIKFIEGSVVDDLFESPSFDVICSFETIEHLPDDIRRTYVQNLQRWLKPSGILLLSTPNKRITSPFTQKPLNKFHVLEFHRDQLIAEISPFFMIDSIYGQRLVKRIYTYRLVRKAIRLLDIMLRKNISPSVYDTPTSSDVVWYDPHRFEPRYFVVAATPRT